MVEIKAKVQEEKVVGYKCDICGFIIKQEEPLIKDFADIHYVGTLSAYFGYGSDKDTEQHQCHMCELCYDKVRKFIEVTLGGQIHVTSHMFAERRSWLKDHFPSINMEDLEDK